MMAVLLFVLSYERSSTNGDDHNNNNNNSNNSFFFKIKVKRKDGVFTYHTPLLLKTAHTASSIIFSHT